MGSLGGKAGDEKGGVGDLKEVRDGRSETSDVDRSRCVEITDGGRR